MYNAELALLDDLEQGREVPNLSDLGTLDFSHLRTGIAAGSPVPDETMRRLIKRMNLRDLTITYGQTESVRSAFALLSSLAKVLAVTCDHHVCHDRPRRTTLQDRRPRPPAHARPDRQPGSPALPLPHHSFRARRRAFCPQS